ncbi:uncharacterized protein LDX57_012658 [Aspergillus melleus]|uniref:uncharacterized protein n=1 Tax=Aspergillus melleus TaxID=138277 RepID=UPI001E8D2016|nr:uncharacterized protein LDX57_012658 [Aspergillus melleus]KAH8435029.1 hypothetical protein LDX57_012658 [Aspergillus melleus]
MPSMPSLPPQFVTADQLRQILNANSAYPDDDLVREFGDSIESQRRKCIPWVMANELFQAWLRQAQSQVLVINSMTDDIQENEAITPLSCVCVLLGRTLRRLPSCAALTFYCGLHASPGDNLEGGNGIMRSLVYQVLQQYGDSLNLSFLNFQILQQIQGRDLATLCICFQRLLESVGTGVVVCLIDETSWYETDSRSAEMEFVMRFLNNLVADVQASGGGFVFKVLVTASTVSQYSRIWFPGAWTILVEDDLVTDGQDSDEMQFLMA